MRISRRVREEAIDGCEMIASDRAAGIDAFKCGEFGGDGLSSVDDAVVDLASSAYFEVRRAATEMLTGNAWAEAAALLRGDDEHEPWSPGDPVYLRGGR